MPFVAWKMNWNARKQQEYKFVTKQRKSTLSWRGVSGIGMPCVFHFQRIRCGKKFADLKKKFVVGDKYVLLYELLLYEILKLEDT